MRTVSDAPKTAAARLVSAGSAFTVGAFGWLLAHVATFWFVVQNHQGPLSLSSRHVHSYTAALTMAAGCLAAVMLFPGAIAVGPTSHRPSTSPRHRAASVVRSMALSTIAFFAVDAFEHAVLHVEPSTPALITLGACLHALFGAAGSLFWLVFTDSVTALRPLSPPDAAATTAPRRLPQSPFPSRRRPLLAYAAAGRAPPAF